jgi:hypothetical protein
MSRLIVISVVVGLALFGLLSFSLAEENLTITTYYPSPYGSYRQLNVSNTLVVGPFSVVDPATVSAVAVAGGTAEYIFARRNLPTVADPTTYGWAAGDRYYLYSQDGLAAYLSTDDFGNIFGVTNAGSVHIYSAAETTTDGIGIVYGYTTGEQARYPQNNHSTP